MQNITKRSRETDSERRKEKQNRDKIDYKKFGTLWQVNRIESLHPTK